METINANFLKILDKKTILLSGNMGYIGSHLETYLKRQYPSTRFFCLDIKNGSNNNICDLQPILDTLPEKIDIILHLAALSNVPDCANDPAGAWKTNVFGTINLLELAKLKQTELFVNTDSSMTGLSPSVYAETKAAAAMAAKAYSKYFRVINLQLFNVAGHAYGLKENHEPETHFIPNLLASNKDKPCYLDSRDPSRDFVHIDDVIRAFSFAIENYYAHLADNFRFVGFDNYHVGTGKVMKLSEIVQLCNDMKIPVTVITHQMGDDRWEPSIKFMANKKNWVPGWAPISSMEDILLSVYNPQ